jgi:chitodextrinase
MNLQRSLRFPLALILVALAAGMTVPAARAGTISMAWDPVPDADAVGYQLEYGTAPGNYTQQREIGLVTSYTLDGLSDCTTWYVAIKARDGVGNLSTNFSNELSGWPRPTVTSAFPALAEQGRQLDVVLSGTNFQSGASLSFSDPGITVNSISVDSCNQLTANITVGNSVAPGAISVDVINADQTFGTGAAVFTVDPASAPWVVDTDPADGATGVSVAFHPTVDFSEPLDPASVTSSGIRLLDGSGNPVAQAGGSPTLSADGLTATIVPAADLTMGGTYRIEVVGTSGVQDLAGHPLDSTYTQTLGFQTVGDSVPPAISAVTSGTVGATSAEITWVTDEAADSQVLFRVMGQSEYQQTAVDATLVTDHFLVVQGLFPETTYEYHVRSADSAGNAVESSPDETFTTSTSSHVYLRFEAEGGALTAPMRSVTGANAFGDAWIDTPAGTSTGTSSSPAGTAVFGVNIPSAGTWYLWVRIHNPSSSGGTMYESVDGAVRVLMDVSAAGEWEWAAGRSYTLDAGLHSLELGGRRAEARADRILLTDDPNFVPTEQPMGDVTPPPAPGSFAAAASDQVNVLTWNNPLEPDLERVIIRVRTDGSHPVSPLDGFAVTDQPATPGDGDSFTHSGLANGTTYSYSIFAVDTWGNVSLAAQAQGTPFDDLPPAEVQNLRRTDTWVGP